MRFTFFIWVPHCFHLFILSVFLILFYWSAAHSSLLYLNIKCFSLLPENTVLCSLLLDAIWLLSPWRPLQFTYNPGLQSTCNCPQRSVIDKSQVPCFYSIMKVLIKIWKRSGHKSRLWKQPTKPSLLGAEWFVDCSSSKHPDGDPLYSLSLLKTVRFSEVKIYHIFTHTALSVMPAILQKQKREMRPGWHDMCLPKVHCLFFFFLYSIIILSVVINGMFNHLFQYVEWLFPGELSYNRHSGCCFPSITLGSCSFSTISSSLLRH